MTEEGRRHSAVRSPLDALIDQVLRSVLEAHAVDPATEGCPGTDAKDPERALINGADFLRRRARKLLEAERKLSSIAEQFVAERENVGFTEFGWPELRRRISGAFAKGDAIGLTQWLDAWFEAAAEGRLYALDRLATDIEVPPCAELVQARGKTATAGLRARNPHLAAPMLDAGLAGVLLAGDRLPNSRARGGLALLKLRLAVEAKCDETEFETLVGLAADNGDALTLAALRARWLRKSGTDAMEDAPVFTIEDATNLDVAVELILATSSEQSPEYGVKIARKAVEAISILRRPQHVINALLTDVPPEIWIAAAERAVSECNQEAFENCLGSVRFDDNINELLWGTYYWIQARGYDVFGETAEKRATAWHSAGANFLWTPERKLAYDCMKKAHSLVPDDVGHLMAYGEALRTINWDRPLVEARAEIEEVLARFYTAVEANQPKSRAALPHSTASRLHDLLARRDGSDQATQRWMSFVSAARSVLLDRTIWYSWTTLAAAAVALGLEQLDLVFTRVAYKIQDNLDTRDNFCRALFNAAEFDELEPILDRCETVYGVSIKVFLHYCQGRHSEALALFEKHAIPQSFHWAWNSAISAQMLLGHQANAERLSREYRDYWARFENEELAYPAMAFHPLVTGDFEKAIRLLSKPQAPDDWENTLRGISELLSGAHLQGIDRLSAVARSTTSIITATEWLEHSGDWITVIAELYDVTVPDLSAVNKLFAERLEFLRATMTPERELANVDTDAEQNREVARTGKALGRLLLTLACDGPAAAAEELERVREVLSPRDFEIARDGVLPVTAPADPAPPEPDARIAEAASSPPRIRLLVSDRWFDGYRGREETHPILLRWLPEARVWYPELPAVNVSGEDGFEPGHYSIEIDGKCVDEGYFDPNPGRYPVCTHLCFGLPEDNTSPMEKGYVRIEEVPAGPLADLLEITAAELVLRRLWQVCLRELKDR